MPKTIQGVWGYAPPENSQHQDPQIDLKNEFHATKFLGFCSFMANYVTFRGLHLQVFQVS